MKLVLEWMYVVARYLVAFIILFYGFAKLNHAQFNILDSELDKPMGQVSGFWLTWYYFGYSSVYGTFIALAQVIPGILLMFRRTTLLGSCVLLPVIGNIILIDIFFGVDVGALMVALFILGCLLFIVSQHHHDLIGVFWSKQNSVFPSSQRHKLVVAAKALVCVLVIVVPCALTYLIANYNNRHPTPIDGTWNLVERSPNLEASTLPAVVFFERNLAGLVVFKYEPPKYESHHFEVDPTKGTIKIWEEWLRKGKTLFEGKYELSDTNLVMHGHFAEQAGESTLRWAKKKS